jgi:TonB family protein
MRSVAVIALSLGFHLALQSLLGLIPPPVRTTYAKPPTIEWLEYPELSRRPRQAPANQKQFVRFAPTPESLQRKIKNKEAPSASFASKEEQFVLEERRARESGLTQNRSPSSSTAQSHSALRSNDKLDFRPNSSLSRLETELSSKSEDRLGTIPLASDAPPATEGSRPLEIPKSPFGETGLSTVGEALPEHIKFGDFTALNTDRHLYYSFYARIEELIRYRWVNYANAIIANYLRSGYQRPDRDTWTTKLEIILDRDGNFLNAVMYESSGLRGLDAAPVQAFRDARKIPNPPNEMVKPDGTIRLQYSFRVTPAPRLAGVR